MRPLSIAILLALVAPLALGQSSKLDQDKVKLSKLEKAYTEAKAAFSKKPKAAKLKAAYVKSAVEFGTATMLSPNLTPKQKYPGALKLYREALKLDPKNAEALKNKKMIEDIYTQMGRPIPK